MLRSSIEFQLMMTPDENDSACHPLEAVRHGTETNEELDQQKPTPGGDPGIRTAENAIRGLRSLGREARALRDGLSRLSEGEEFGHPSARRHLRFGQSALEHGAAVFELLANLLESD